MSLIEEIELNHPDGRVESSYHPEEYREPYDSKRTGGSRKGISSANHQRRFLPCHYFDFIVGTSTGGLIAIMLARLRMSVDEAVEVFYDMSKEIFGNPRAPVWFPGIYTYNHRKLEKVIKGIVDRRTPTADPDWQTKEKRFFNEIEGISKCIVVAYGASEQNDSPYLFRSYLSPGKGQDQGPLVRNAGSRDHYPIWMVARATSAAPGYLRKIEIEGRKFIDGGFGCNNPSEELWREINFLYGSTANSLILSIGTGHQTPSPRVGSGIVLLIKKSLRMAVDSEKTHEEMSSKAQNIGFTYKRFNVTTGMQGIRLGEYKKLDEMKEATEKYLSDERVVRELREVAGRLVANRRRRVEENRDRWEAFCCETRYRCLVGPENRCQYGYHERARHRFIEHLQRDHKIKNVEKINQHVEVSKALGNTNR